MVKDGVPPSWSCSSKCTAASGCRRLYWGPLQEQTRVLIHWIFFTGFSFIFIYLLILFPFQGNVRIRHSVTSSHSHSCYYNTRVISPVLTISTIWDNLCMYVVGLYIYACSMHMCMPQHGVEVRTTWVLVITFYTGTQSLVRHYIQRLLAPVLRDCPFSLSLSHSHTGVVYIYCCDWLHQVLRIQLSFHAVRQGLLLTETSLWSY